MALPINVRELIESRVVESTRNDIDNSGGGYIVVGIAEENGMR